MKAELHGPGLYVVKSDYVNGAQRTSFKYDKVAAVSLPEGEASFVSRRKTDGYNPEELVRLEVDVEERILERVAGFVDTYMKDGARLSSYNCHTFASWMVDGPQTTNPLVPRDELTSYRERSLRPGEMGIIYARGGDHSTVGLEGDQTIQVITNHGNIGVLNTDAIFKQYGANPGTIDPAIARRYNIFQLQK
jgi:hypothetical protein